MRRGNENPSSGLGIQRLVHINSKAEPVNSETGPVNIAAAPGSLLCAIVMYVLYSLVNSEANEIFSFIQSYCCLLCNYKIGLMKLMMSEEFTICAEQYSLKT